MSKRVVILGAGFGGLELGTMLARTFGEEVDVTLIDRSDSFVFGFSKLDVMFCRASIEAVQIPYAGIDRPGLAFRRETVTAIDPWARRVETDRASYEADVLVVALGADYDVAATPGLAEGGNEFYSVEGARRLSGIVPEVESGRIVVGVVDAPFKCPPAPSECALLMHDELVARGVRDACEIVLAMPLGTPVPPSPETSAALLEAFAQRGIEFVGGQRIASIEPGRKVAVLDDGGELDFDLFLGVPKHRAPDVVVESGMAEDGYVPVESATLETRFPGVYAVGDVATAGVPKAGVFAEGAARVVGERLIAEWTGKDAPPPYDGRGSCYIEFGADEVARVDIDFLSGPERTGVFNAPSAALVAEKGEFGSSRRARWFGR
ncbi:MAG: FAD-dependent oxidoreductase [Solirubrobacterales bacterium]|nr:FAD-dependent oxidoreductase [Solirubrobacterales bacterium]